MADVNARSYTWRNPAALSPPFEYTVNGREFWGRPDRHAFELFLKLEEIEHRATKVCRPQSNGFVERLHRLSTAA